MPKKSKKVVVSQPEASPVIPSAGPRIDWGSTDDPLPGMPSSPGAEGQASADESTGIESTFQGTVHLRGGGARLDVGGLDVELFATGPSIVAANRTGERQRAASLFKAHDGKSIGVIGTQAGAIIYGARPDVDTEKPAKTAGQTKREWGPAFAKIASAIQKKEVAALRKKPGVLGLRPGFRFKDGWITKEPVLVVTVARKTSAIPAASKLPRSIAGIPIDVRPATPAEQAAGRATSAESAPVGGVQEDFALPGYELAPSAESEERGKVKTPKPTYVPPPDGSLDEVKAAMTVLCHTSPDAGFPTLRDFFNRVTRKMTIAMYDFTAPHVLTALRGAMSNVDGDLTLVLDPKVALAQPGKGDNPKANDVPEEDVRDSLSGALGSRFKFEWAAIKAKEKTTASLFKNAYHIKVAVVDQRSFWLSSGNWQSTNQPDLDPLSDGGDAEILRMYNREWHVVVDNPALAETFDKYIQWDYEQAGPFQAQPEAAALDQTLLVPEKAVLREALTPKWIQPLKKRFTRAAPLRVQPLLTPDNYAEKVLDVIKGAKKSLRFQNQYINIGKTSEALFDELLDALLEKQGTRGFDLKIILRDLPNAGKMLEALQARGFDPERIKLQAGCHTKGIIADGGAAGSDAPADAVVVIGSHNWSSAGTTLNRDASLIFYDRDIARFYRDAFDWDWENLARHKATAETTFGADTGMPILADGGDESAQVKAGKMVLPYSFFDDD